MCGVTIAFGWLRSGLSSRERLVLGHVERETRAACRRRAPRSAASPSTRPPREVLSTYGARRISAISGSPIRWRVLVVQREVERDEVRLGNRLGERAAGRAVERHRRGTGRSQTTSSPNGSARCGDTTADAARRRGAPAAGRQAVHLAVRSPPSLPRGPVDRGLRAGVHSEQEGKVWSATSSRQ